MVSQRRLWGTAPKKREVGFRWGESLIFGQGNRPGERSEWARLPLDLSLRAKRSNLQGAVTIEGGDCHREYSWRCFVTLFLAMTPPERLPGKKSPSRWDGRSCDRISVGESPVSVDPKFAATRPRRSPKSGFLHFVHCTHPSNLNQRNGLRSRAHTSRAAPSPVAVVHRPP